MVELIEIKEQLTRIESGLLSQKSVLTFDEAAQFTGLSKSFLYKLTSSGRVPHFKPHGKVLYFDRSQLETWLLQNPVKTADEIEKEAVKFVTLNRKGGSHV